MELNHLRYFREVARTENISKAAKNLYVTQPAISVTIKKMETELGFNLFERGKNSIKLTEAGRCYLSYVNSVLALLKEGEVKARKVAGQNNDVFRVASGFGVLYGMTADYLQMHPGLNILVKTYPTDEILSRLSDNRADVGFVLNEPSYSHLESHIVMRGRYYICVNAGHAFAARQSVRMADLEGQLLFCSNIANTYQIASEIFKRANVNCNLLTLDEREVLFLAAKKGMGGVFCMPMKTSEIDADKDDLCFVPIEDCTDVGRVVMIFPRDSFHTEEQEQYLAYLQRRFGENERLLRNDLIDHGVPPGDGFL